MSLGAEWTVASDRVTHLAMPSTYRYGAMVAATGSRRVPERYGHAVAPDSPVTLCGVPVGGLHRFDGLTFEALGHHLRCPRCDDRAGHPHLVTAPRRSR